MRFNPPVGESLLRDKLDNWEKFIHSESDLDPIVKMAVAHYQFEAIHPFTDGNGRTGRVVNLLVLVQYELLDMPILYLSRYIIHNKGKYYDLLLRVTSDGAWEPWILYMLSAIADTAVWTLQKIKAIRELVETTTETVKKRLPKIYSRELIEVIFVQPYTRIENLIDAKIAKRETASRYLNALVEQKILTPHQYGRTKLFFNPAYMKLLAKDTPSQ
jgi:Fic family protein